MASPLHVSCTKKFIGATRRTAPRVGRVPLREEEPRKYALQPGRKKQLENLREKQELKERQERLVHAVTQRLAIKFGRKHTELIAFFVEEYFSSKTTVTPADVATIEDEVRKAIQSKSKPSSSNAPRANNHSSSGTRPEVNEPSSNSAGILKAFEGREWEILQAYQSVADEEQIRREKEQVMLRKQKFRRDLDEHMEIANKNKSQMNSEDAAYAASVFKDVESFYREEEQRRERDRELVQTRSRIYKVQIDEYQQRVAREKAQLKAEEEENHRIAQAEHARELEKQRKEKQRQKDLHEFVKKENLRNRQLREEAQRKETEENLRMMREAAERAELQERKREEAFALRMKNLEKWATKFENEGAGKAEREETLRFEQQLLREQTAKEERDRADEIAREQARLRRNREAAEENRRQLELKNTHREEHRKEEANFATQFQNDIANWKREEEALQQKRAQQRREYHSSLTDQVTNARKTRSNITEAERSLNKNTLDELERDPRLLSAVLHRVRMSTSQSARK